MKSLNNFWKQSMVTKLFWVSLNSLNLPEGQDNFQMIQKHPAQTTWKVFRQSDNFPDRHESFHTIWKVYRQPGTLIDNRKLSRQSGNFIDNHETFKEFGKFPVNLESFQTIWKFSRHYEALQASATTSVSQRWTNFCSVVRKSFWTNFDTQSTLRHTAFRIFKKNCGL